MKTLTKISVSVLAGFLLIGCGGDSSSDDEAAKGSEGSTSGYNVHYISNNSTREAVSSTDDYTSILVANTTYFERKTVDNYNKKYSSTEAKSYCRNLNYSAGGWRIPSKYELSVAKNLGSVLNFRHTSYSTYNQNANGDITTSWKCTDSALSCAFQSAPSTNYVICARDLGETAETNLSEKDKEVVKISSDGKEVADNITDYSALLYKDPSLNMMLALERTKAGFLQTKTYEDATNYCKNLSYIGFSNWRLPSLQETEVMFFYYEDNSDELLKINTKDHWTVTTNNYSSGAEGRQLFSIHSSYNPRAPLLASHNYLCVRNNY